MEIVGVSIRFRIEKGSDMKFKKSPRKGNLIVELEPGNTRLINQINGPITALKELLVPVDFSDCSKYALRYALAFAKQFEASVTLVSVVPDDSTSFEYASAEYADIVEARKKRYADELKKLAESLGKVKCQTLVRVGKPFQEIVLAARELDSDLILISTHGQMNMPKAELGSTAERVVRHAPCPVLVVRQKERAFAPPV